MRPTLHQLALSPYCRKVRWVLARKGIAHDVVEATEANRGARLAAAGEDRIPLLIDGETAVAGSTAIAFYLERTAGGPSIFPTDAQKRNQAVTLNEFADKGIGWLTRSLMRDHSHLEIDLGEPIESHREDLIAALRQALGQAREAIARRALDSGACHLGDIAVASHLVTCRSVPELAFTDQYADLEAYVSRIKEAISKQ